MSKKDRTILIIGGMGPSASLHVHSKLIDSISLNRDLSNSDYPNIIHLSINAPDFIDGNILSAKRTLDYVKQKIDLINISEVDVGFIACNTMHIFFKDINRQCNGKLLSVPDLVKERIVSRKVGLLGTPFTLKKRLI